MKTRRLIGILSILLLLATAVLVLAQSPAQAQAPQQGGYDLSWWTVDGGGTFSTGGGYSLGGTAGQADPGVLTNGSYNLGGGFWRGGAAGSVVYKVYLPVVLKSFP